MRATIHHHGGLRSLPGSRRPQGMELGQQRPPSRNLRRSVVVMRVTTDERVVAAAAPRDKTVYKDNWFERLAIHHLSSAIEATTGMTNKKEGYESLVAAAIMISKKFDTKAQQGLVIRSLQEAFPSAILTMANKDFTSTFNIFKRVLCSFHYHVLPLADWPLRDWKSRNLKSRGNQRKMWFTSPNADFVILNLFKKKNFLPCRFLENTNCVGMCTNLCKIPSQKFIQDSLGMPVYMVPSMLLKNDHSQRIGSVKHFLSSSLLDFSRRLVPLSAVLYAMSKDGSHQPLLCSTFFHSSRCLRRNVSLFHHFPSTGH
ncbi:unnamed protein product [Musa hybrid cultivar]